ncbi:trypsin-like serine peptidase [Hazenella coriacea]|uniref:V8-like Glu-specific endopeptidase n=1 Tax=Hazenella coriacea TaxID=1179467 RepID=A0A4R3L3Z3_9BACL|nr:hypothetical protein [Hazenella coriacea]TCS92575.1 V8-like Glu-specific endopeptidase [Hazenella coriacea]
MVSPVVHCYTSTHLFQEYWTDDKRQKAKPIEIPVLDEKLLKSEDYSQMKATPHQVDVTTYPYSSGGKLFVSDPDGTNRTGTAQFVSSGNILLTAAHVVIDDKGNFRKHPVFARAYDQDQGESFVVKGILVWDEWIKNKNPAYDYAFCLTSKPYEEGVMSLKLGCTYSQFQSIGYPENYGLKREMYAVNGTKGMVSRQVVQMKGNPFGKGASGGAWIAEEKYIIGNNSFRLNNDLDSLWGPLFDQKTEELFVKATEVIC